MAMLAGITDVMVFSSFLVFPCVVCLDVKVLKVFGSISNIYSSLSIHVFPLP
jgi:hypothetical protein